MELSSEMKRGVDYIGVGVGAIIVDEQGRLFLARRGPKAKNERGLWEFPGSSVELSEIGWFAAGQVPTALTAISRENLENYVKLKDRTPANEEPWL